MFGLFVSNKELNFLVFELAVFRINFYLFTYHFEEKMVIFKLWKFLVS